VSVGAKGTNLSKLRARAGMVFQHFELFPHLTIMENLTLAQVKVLGRTRDQAVDRGCSCWTASDCAIRPTSTPGSCRAASSSASRSRGRCAWTRS